MREILFRGKTRGGHKGVLTDKPIKAGVWVYGCLTVGSLCGYKRDLICDQKETYVIISETVGQFIGITDKNGVKIFEGDIVKMSFIEEGEEWEPEYLTVYWDDKVNGFLCHSNQTTMSVDSDLLSDGEVVGNIHDNPELVEVEACRM